MSDTTLEGIEPKTIMKIIESLNPEQRRLFELFSGQSKQRARKGIEDADISCPYCESGEIEYDNQLREDFNITIQECQECGNEWCKEQSVKIPAVLVRQIAETLRVDPSFTGVSEFVRAAIRTKCEITANSPRVTAERNMDFLANTMLLAAGFEEIDDEEDWL